MIPLGQAILDILQAEKSHAQAPMRVDALHARLPADTPLDRVDAEIEALFAARAINRCRRERDGQVWDEVWLTGIVGAGAAWKTTHIKRTPPVLPTRIAPPQTKEPTMPSTLYTPTGKPKEALAVIIEHGPITGRDLAEKIGVGTNQVNTCTKRLLEASLVFKEKIGRHTWFMTTGQVEVFRANRPGVSAPKAQHSEAEIQVSETRTDDVAQSAATSDALPPPPPQAGEGWGGGKPRSEQVREVGMQFLVGDDASLTIIDADEIMRIPPAEACRLAEFLRDCAPVFGV